MNARVLVGDLKKAVDLACKVKSSRSTLPIIQCIALEVKDGVASLRATDLETYLRCEVGAHVDEPGGFAVPAVLKDLLHAYVADTVDLTSKNGKGSSGQLVMKCGRDESRLSCEGLDQFPPTPDVDGEFLELDKDDFVRCVGMVTCAAATEETRPVLCGVNMKFTETPDGAGWLAFAGADGFRLSVAEMAVAKAVSGDVIASPKLLELVCGQLQAQKEADLKMRFDQRFIEFHVGKVILTGCLTQGSYPDYVQLIPKAVTTTATVNKADFVRAVKTASVTSKDSGGVVRMYLLDKELHLGSKTGIGDRVAAVVAATVEGRPAKIAFNAKYLKDLGVACHGESLIVRMTTSSSPVLWSGNEDGSYTLMPMFIAFGDDDLLAAQVQMLAAAWDAELSAESSDTTQLAESTDTTQPVPDDAQVSSDEQPPVSVDPEF